MIRARRACEEDGAYIIKESPIEQIEINVSPSNGNNCTGSIDVIIPVSSEDITYEFEWSNGEITEDISNLCVGTYIVTITDEFGCSIIREKTLSCAFNNYQTATDIDCHNPDAAKGFGVLEVERRRYVLAVAAMIGDGSSFEGIKGDVWRMAWAKQVRCRYPLDRVSMV